MTLLSGKKRNKMQYESPKAAIEEVEEDIVTLSDVGIEDSDDVIIW